MEVDDLSSGSFKSIRIHMNSDRLFNLILVYTCFIILKESGFLISVLYFFALSKKFFLDIFSARLQFLSKHGNCGLFLYFSVALFT